MKVSKLDCIWACVSVLGLGISFHFGMLLWGILGVYVLMVMLFMGHIFSIRKRQERSVAVFGTVEEYNVSKELKTSYYPVMSYTTEIGDIISSAYTIADKQQRYEIGSQEMICYDPDEPEFFYFANRESDMTRDYYRFIIYGSVPALFVLVMLIFN